MATQVFLKGSEVLYQKNQEWSLYINFFTGPCGRACTIQRFNDPKAFIEYSNDICDVYKNSDEYNVDKERKILIVFDMIADIIKNKKLNLIVTELFIRGRKINISLVFITQSYFKVPKDVRLNTTHFLFQKFQIKENFEKLQYIIHQILVLKILKIFIKDVLLNRIHFLLMILYLHQIIL